MSTFNCVHYAPGGGAAKITVRIDHQSTNPSVFDTNKQKGESRVIKAGFWRLVRYVTPLTTFEVEPGVENKNEESRRHFETSHTF
jgi:hypothetical protein